MSPGIPIGAATKAGKGLAGGAATKEVAAETSGVPITAGKEMADLSKNFEANLRKAFATRNSGAPPPSSNSSSASSTPNPAPTVNAPSSPGAATPWASSAEEADATRRRWAAARRGAARAARTSANAAKTAGAAGAGLMTGLAAGTMAAGRKAKNKVNSLGSSSKDSSSDSKGWVWLKILFWVTVGAQVIDVFYFKMNRTIYFYPSLIMYGLIAVLALIFFSLDEEAEEGHLVTPRQIIGFIAISFFYLVIPMFLYILPDVDFIGGKTLLDWVGFFLAILPIWPLYIGFKIKYKFVHSYVNLWIIVLLFVFIFGVGLKLNPTYFSFIGGRAENIQFGTVANFILDEVKDIGVNFWNTIKKVSDPRQYAFYNNSIGYYMGEIEGRNDQEPVGLYLTNVYAAEKYFYKGYPAILWADIRGKSFVEQINIQPTCVIDKVGMGISQPPYFSLLGSELTSFSCTFTGLEPGTYTARVGAKFNFETWAYVTYTFVDLETKRSLEMQGKNINSELKIPSLPRSVYTPGPIMLGMSAQVDLPVGIDTKYNTREPVLGVTIDNAWTDGFPRTVNEFMILVPDDFQLVKCDRWYPLTEKAPDESEGGVDTYKFLKTELGDVRQGFQSITCRLHIKNPAGLLSGAQKVERTFVAIAKYDYEMEKRKSITVRE